MRRIIILKTRDSLVLNISCLNHIHGAIPQKIQFPLDKFCCERVVYSYIYISQIICHVITLLLRV